MKLKFSPANTKLKKLEKTIQLKVISFSLPSGYACPGACDCLSRADRKTGKIKDGAQTKFRCFQASGEAVYKSLRKMVWDNFDAIKACKGADQIYALINSSLPDFFNVCRIHVGGDFFSQDYFDAWLKVAENNPNRIFYAYTKSLNFWIARLGKIPSNLLLTASRGGKFDSLIEKFNLKSAEVVFSEKEAMEKSLELDNDDSHAATGTDSFALLIHGVQPKGSVASLALTNAQK